MAKRWTFTTARGVEGHFQVVVTRVGRGDFFGTEIGKPTDVTTFRGVPTLITSYSSGDPFGDGAASLTFPAVTGFDDFDSIEIGSWLGKYSDIDINFIQAGRPKVRVYEGYIASLTFTESDQLEVSCVGALYQLDRYLQKPFYPANPQTLESMIASVFSHAKRPHLRTKALRIEWPAGWTKLAPSQAGLSNAYIPNIKPGQKWSGYASRATGAWDRSLTGFVQDQISTMLTQAGSGVTNGNQWTVMQARRWDAKYPMGRTPVLRIRDRFRTPDFALWYQSPGVTCSLTCDTTQEANLVYGDGTDLSGAGWRNAVISADGSRTDYTPLAASESVWPPGNKYFDPGAFAAEAYVKYGTGFNQPDAVISANQTLQRDLDAGWSGTITVRTDPSEDLTRWHIAAGMALKLKGFNGSGARGMTFHVSQVQASVQEQSVELTVDTRFRDLLNLEEALARTRDPLTPSKLLAVNRMSVIIEDVQAPWDYSAGSGYMPKASRALYDYVPKGEGFPYADWVGKHPPFKHPSWYVQCNADAATRAERWAGPIPILMSEKGTISRTELFCVNKYGQLVLDRFHFSLWKVAVNAMAMPRDGQGPSPWITGAFESIDPSTGQEWPSGSPMKPQVSFMQGWGNYQQPAGFSPGLFTSSPPGHPTGELTDDAVWTFDCTDNPNYQRYAKKESASVITIYAMFYCEYSEPVYFSGRLFRQAQGQ